MLHHTRDITSTSDFIYNHSLTSAAVVVVVVVCNCAPLVMKSSLFVLRGDVCLRMGGDVQKIAEGGETGS